MVFQLVHVYLDLLGNPFLVAITNVIPIVIVDLSSNVKTLNASRHAINAEKELNVFVFQIIVLSVNALKITSDLHIPSVVPNVMAMLIVPEVNLPAFMAFVKIPVMELVESGLIVI